MFENHEMVDKEDTFTPEKFPNCFSSFPLRVTDGADVDLDVLALGCYRPPNRVLRNQIKPVRILKEFSVEW